MTKTLFLLATFISATPGFVLAQDSSAPPPPEPAPQQQQQPNGGWRRVGDGAPAQGSARDEYGQPQSGMNNGGPNYGPQTGPPPSQLVIPAGAWVRIRVDQVLSSDRNLAGDRFSATLTQPIVADGFVVARRGQTIEGRVTDAIKAGKAKGTSRLGLELVNLSLVDGRQMPLRTQLVEYQGGTSVGRDVAAAGAATGTGAAIGAVAGGGVGAAIGAAVGAAASGVGILTTRGRATEIYPETEVTFRTMEPITVNTDRSAQAFLPVRQNDYEPQFQQRPPATVVRPAPMYGYGYPYYGGGYWGSYWGPGWGYGPYWGPSFSFYGSRFYGGGFRGGFRGRR